MNTTTIQYTNWSFCLMVWFMETIKLGLRKNIIRNISCSIFSLKKLKNILNWWKPSPCDYFTRQLHLVRISVDSSSSICLSFHLIFISAVTQKPKVKKKFLLFKFSWQRCACYHASQRIIKIRLNCFLRVLLLSFIFRDWWAVFYSI